MLAFLGFIVQEFVRLPGDLYSEPNGVKAFFQVRPSSSSPDNPSAPRCRLAHARHTVPFPAHLNRSAPSP